MKEGFSTTTKFPASLKRNSGKGGGGAGVLILGKWPFQKNIVKFWGRACGIGEWGRFSLR